MDPMNQYDLFSAQPEQVEVSNSTAFNFEPTDQQTGFAGESLVLSKLLRWGFDAHPTGGAATHDVAVFLPGGKYCRIQVKTRRASSKGMWRYNLTRGYHNSATGMYRYNPEDFDVFAAVALDIDKVLFAPGPIDSFVSSNAGFMSEGIELLSLKKTLEFLDLIKIH